MTLCASALIVVAATGCRSGRDAASGGQTSSAAAAGTLTKGKADARFEALVASYGAWHDLRIPVEMKLRKPAAVSISGTLSMVRDSVAHFSFRFLGMEVLTAMVTPDSIYASYRLDKVYIAESTPSLLRGFPAGVGDLQNLLLGRLFALGAPGIGLKDVRLEDRGSGYTVTPLAAAGVRTDAYFFRISAANSLEALVVDTGSAGAPVECRYAAPKATAFGPVSPQLSIAATLGKTTLDASVELNVGKARVDQGVNVRWRVPKGYKRIPAASLLRAIPSL